MKDQKKEYYSNLILRNHNDSKKISKCLKDIIPKSPDILPHMINVNGAPVTDNASIAEAFNEFFITNATKITKDIPQQKISEEARESNVNVNDSSHFSLQPVMLDFVIKEIDHLCKDIKGNR